MARILVVGRSGQVAMALAHAAMTDKDCSVINLGRPKFDLTDTDTVATRIAEQAPDIVINAAAYTAVDKAESEPDLAHAINAVAAGEVARGAAISGAPIIHLSTDYVFDGALERPYREDDTVAPLGVYGRTKLEGEERVRAANPDHLIVRTAWVYSPYGANFVQTMLRLGAERDALSVVDDQTGCPTSADDLAKALLMIAREKLDSAGTGATGIIHLAGTGETSWYGLAAQVFKTAAASGRKAPGLTPIPTEHYPTPAARPANSRLDCSRARDVFGVGLPDWRTSVTDVTQRIIAA